MVKITVKGELMNKCAVCLRTDRRLPEVCELCKARLDALLGLDVDGDDRYGLEALRPLAKALQGSPDEAIEYVKELESRDVIRFEVTKLPRPVEDEKLSKPIISIGHWVAGLAHRCA